MSGDNEEVASRANGDAQIFQGRDVVDDRRTSASTDNSCRGFSLHDLYKLATTFQKEKEGKALHLSYDEKLKLVALSQQVSHGPYDDVAAKPVGYLDVIGKDRRQAWKAIGNLSKAQAMEEYVGILSKACPLFDTHVEAHKRDVEEKERRTREREENLRMEEEARLERRLQDEARRREEHEQRRTEMQRQQIQDALNQQTFFQFKAYAEQQFPGNPEQQAILIKQLQEQHYQQYIQQVYQQQAAQSLQRQESRMEVVPDDETRSSTGAPEEATNSSESGEEPETEWTSPVKPASMWTRKDIADFKTSLQKEGGDSIIKVGHGETVTVRVPTHEDGTCLFWEFATDSYDIGFGVYFEWTKTPGTQVSVHISESEEEEDDEDGAHQSNGRDDVEKGLPAEEPDKGLAEKLPMTVIIPIYRRDCHEEVYAGSHVYPGQGVYLLKFDNSYSLWRSKTLYYRVYYTH